MFKRLTTTALLLTTTLALIAGCQGAGNDAAPAEEGDDPAPATTAPAVRAPEPRPIEAVFTQERFTTDYTTTIANPDRDDVVLTWSGPHCGFFAADTALCNTDSCTARFTWNHASPPCAEHQHHDDTTIVFQAIGRRSGKTVLCTYAGAASGTGPRCYQNGFNGTELGTAYANSAFVRYHLPLDKQCSKVDLIQVMSIVDKRSGRVAVPHNSAMDEPALGEELTSLGYQAPLAADDADGHVVDKFYYRDIGTNDPYYSGAVSGSPARDAELDDRPANIREGHVGRFEVCAFCSGDPGDAEYGNYVGCFTYEYDADTGAVRKSDRQNPQAPTPEFRAAVERWNVNKGFTMPSR